jgi:hypothetical protein
MSRPDYTSLVPKKSRETRDGALSWCSGITSLTVSTDEEMQNAALLTRQAATHIRELKARKKEDLVQWEEKVSAVKQYYDEAIAALCNLVEKFDEGIADRRKLLADQVAEEKRKNEAAAAAERQKILDKAEADRKRAAELREQGKDERADHLEMAAEQKAATASSVVAKPVASPPKVAGISTSIRWVGEITDPIEFVAGAIETNHSEWLEPNKVAFNSHARTMRRPMTVRGGRIFSEESTSHRSVS